MAEFTRSFPDDPELKRLVEAFESGDYYTVRSGAPALAERTTDPAVRKAALELRRRIEPDPAQLYLLGLTFALLVFLVAWFYLHKH
jgi:anti-sigma factor RsiW